MEHRAYGTGQLVRAAGAGSDLSLQPSAPTAEPPAGWYDDPGASGRLRFWDGSQWTDQTRTRYQAPQYLPSSADLEVQRFGPDKAPSAPLSVVAAALALSVPILFLVHFRLNWAELVTLFVVYGCVTYLASKQRNVEFEVTVGRHERHVVRYRRNNWWGWVQVDVDGRRVLRKWVILGLRLQRSYPLTVGTVERHHVNIVRTRPLLFPWLRRQPVEVFVDGELVATHSVASAAN
jgi:hypothetical protein